MVHFDNYLNNKLNLTVLLIDYYYIYLCFFLISLSKPKGTYVFFSGHSILIYLVFKEWFCLNISIFFTC